MENANEENDFIEKFKEQLIDLRTTLVGQCPDSDKLIQYFKDELTSEEKERFEGHFDSCPGCLETLQRWQHSESMTGEKEALPRNWNEIAARMDAQVYPYLSSIEQPAAADEIRTTEGSGLLGRLRELSNRLVPAPRLAYAGLAVVFCVGFTYGYAFLSRPNYYHLAQIYYQDTGAIRGESFKSEKLQKGLQAFAHGKFGDAITWLNQFLENAPEHYQANFSLGLAYLFESKKALLGLPYSFDAKNVGEGIRYLTRALALSSENPFYREDCLWYLGKAYLMKDDIGGAEQQFERILKLNRPNLMKRDAVKDMLKKIAALESE